MLKRKYLGISLSVVTIVIVIGTLVAAIPNAPKPRELDATNYTESGSDTLTNNVDGNAATATLAVKASALAANPTDCAPGSYPLGVEANGDAQGCTADRGAIGIYSFVCPGCDLAGISLPGEDLSNAWLRRAILTGADLSNTDLTGAVLTGVTSSNIVGIPSALPSEWMLVSGYLIGPGANLTGADLSNLDLAGAVLRGTLLTSSNLTNADLSNANLEGLRSGTIVGTPSALPSEWTLISGYLIGPRANLTNAALSNANLSNAVMRDANLNIANLTGANLTGADLTGANLEGVRSGNILGIPSALPSEWTLISGYLIGPGANLTGADLSNTDLAGAVLRNAHLRNAHLTGANLTGANLANANLIFADLSNADLTDVNLPGANLTGANLTGANLANANLTGADLVNANLTGADLSTADLTDARLAGANLTGANLTGTNLTGAVLGSIRSGTIIGIPSTLPSEWTLISGYLIGPGAYLANEDLSNTDLSNLDLTGANLSGANLTGANLTGANLTGAILTGPFIWSNTTCPDGSNSDDSDGDGATCLNNL